MVPATTTEVRAGINNDALKTPLIFPLTSFELTRQARTMGIGISRISVNIMYLKLFATAIIKIRSLKRRIKLSAAINVSCPGRIFCVLIIPDLISGTSQNTAKVRTNGRINT